MIKNQVNTVNSSLQTELYKRKKDLKYKYLEQLHSDSNKSVLLYKLYKKC